MIQSRKPITVLVVDDEPLIRMVATEVLEEVGFATFEADDADDALRQLSLHPDITVLFTDINMPGSMDGLDLARVVHARRPDIQLIIASGKLRPKMDEIPDDGQFLAKPYDLADVARLIAAQQGEAARRAPH